MIVAIEGMDGVGKTTVAKSVEKDLLFEYVKDPLKELFEIDNEHLTKISDKIFNSGNDKLISWYLGLGDSYALSRYRNKDIVMDRHILLNYFWNGNKNTEKIFEKGVSEKENHTGLGLWEVRKIIKKTNNVNLYTTKSDKFFKQQLEIYY